MRVVRAKQPGYPGTHFDPQIAPYTIDGQPIVQGGRYWDANGDEFAVSAVYIEFTPHGDVVIGVRASGSRCDWWNLFATREAAEAARKGA